MSIKPNLPSFYKEEQDVTPTLALNEEEQDVEPSISLYREEKKLNHLDVLYSDFTRAI